MTVSASIPNGAGSPLPIATVVCSGPGRRAGSPAPAGGTVHPHAWAGKPRDGREASKEQMLNETAPKQRTAKPEPEPEPKTKTGGPKPLDSKKSSPLPDGGLFTGLVDYGFWQQMFEGHQPEKGEYRAGRIWA
jgi:cyanobactin cluster PatC/TenC/TruC protein